MDIIENVKLKSEILVSECLFIVSKYVFQSHKPINMSDNSGNEDTSKYVLQYLIS